MNNIKIKFGLPDYKDLLRNGEIESDLELNGRNGRYFSLENILKLSIGSLRLAKDREKNAFVLVLTDIALKLLGIVGLPLGGSTCQEIYGYPK